MADEIVTTSMLTSVSGLPPVPPIGLVLHLGQTPEQQRLTALAPELLAFVQAVLAYAETAHWAIHSDERGRLVGEAEALLARAAGTEGA